MNHPSRTQAAVQRLAEREGYALHCGETSHGSAIYRLYDDLGEYGEQTICQCVQMDDGRWIAADYSARNLQWQSGDMRASFFRRGGNQGFRYAFASSLAGLARYGVRTYKSATECLRAGVRDYES